jgi:hypothetical protein
MGTQVNAKRGSPNEGDRKAEEAAAKVRHTAEQHDGGKSTEQEKTETDSATVEAHAELERPEHYKGHPRPNSIRPNPSE